MLRYKITDYSLRFFYIMCNLKVSSLLIPNDKMKLSLYTVGSVSG